ncbi:hypothetical protein JM658_17055, partial [Joostella atrarenae]
LTVGALSCDGAAYSVSYISNGTISINVGTLDTANNMITNIPFESDLVITSSNGVDCETSIMVAIPATCPDDCVTPDLSA